MKDINLTIRIDADTKARATEVLDDMGLTISAACNIFLKQVIKEERIPFIVGKPRVNAETDRVIRESAQGEGLSQVFHSIDELLEDLHA
jgi:DNA-damage-inducible protein J